MVTKDELVKMLEDAVSFEERSVPLLCKKINTCLREMRRAELTDQDRRKMRRMLARLVSDARDHRLALVRMIARVVEAPRHEF